MACVYTYNGVNYSYAELAAALHGGLLDKLVGDGVVNIGEEVRATPDEKREEVRVEPVKPIRELGTGANVYFETNKYRVNDNLKEGGYLLNVGNQYGEVPLANVKFDDANEAVFVAEKLNELLPDGFVPDYHNVDNIINDLKNQYAAKITSAEGVDVGEQSRNGEKVGERNAEEKTTEKNKEKKPKQETLKRRALALDAFDAEDFVLQYFVRGGKVSPKLLESQFGVKGDEDATKRKVTAERKARISYLSSKSKAEKTDQLAEDIYNDVPEELRDTVELSDVRNALEDVILSYIHPARMAERMIDKYARMGEQVQEQGDYGVDTQAITDDEQDALEQQPEIQEAVELTLDNLSEQQAKAFNSVINRFTKDGVVDYDAIIDAIDNFDFGQDAIFVEEVNRQLDNNLKKIIYEYRERKNENAAAETSSEKGEAIRQLEAKTRAAEEVLMSARIAYDRKKMQLGRDILDEQPALFEEKREDVLFEDTADVSQSNIDAILKPYKTDVENAQAVLDELRSDKAMQDAIQADKMQSQITFTQGVVNDAIGIGDSESIEDLEDKGIIKKQCE